MSTLCKMIMRQNKSGNNINHRISRILKGEW